MIVGIGLDLVEVERMRSLVENDGPFVERTFTPGEIGYCRKKSDPAPHFAARFAAKEAAAKALGTGLGGNGVSLLDIEVVHEDGGKPFVRWTGAAGRMVHALGATRTHLSLTHTTAAAAAQVVLEG